MLDLTSDKTMLNLKGSDPLTEPQHNVKGPHLSEFDHRQLQTYGSIRLLQPNESERLREENRKMEKNVLY